MPGQPGGDQPEKPRGRAGKDKADDQAHDGLRACELGEQRGRIGRETDKARLPERSLPADAGEQHQAERDQRGQSDIAEQRDVKFGQHRGNEHNGGNRRRHGEPTSSGVRRHARSSVDPLRNESQTRTGISRVNTITSR